MCDEHREEDGGGVLLGEAYDVVEMFRLRFRAGKRRILKTI